MVQDFRPKDGSRKTHYADLKKKVEHEKPPIYNKMDKIEKSVGRMDDARATIVSGAGKFFRDLAFEKPGMEVAKILANIQKNQLKNYLSFCRTTYVNQIKLMTDFQDLTDSHTGKLSSTKQVTCGKNLLLMALSIGRFESQDRNGGHRTLLDNFDDVSRACSLAMDALESRWLSNGKVLFVHESEEMCALEVLGKIFIIYELCRGLLRVVLKK